MKPSPACIGKVVPPLPRLPSLTARGPALAFLVIAWLGVAGPAAALLTIDFEQAYYVHEDHQVWDFCLVRTGGLYMLFYGAVPVAEPSILASDHLWRSTSPDLVHWSPPAVILSVDDGWESEAVWAPDVVFDENSGYWWLAYTGVDGLRNQRIGVARSTGLLNWMRSPYNPVQEPEPPDFLYDPEVGWSECRDPFMYRSGEIWSMLTTVRTPVPPGDRTALAVCTSANLLDWSDPQVFLLNDGTTPSAALESSQYHVRGDTHHLFFHEYATGGITHLGASDPSGWSFEDRTLIDQGLAPEVDRFDGDHWLLSRVAPYQEPGQDPLAFVVRVDTLNFGSAGQAPEVVRALPLGRWFSSFVGNSVLGNPVFGDNPARRGEPPVGLVGNGYFGSAEYFQGPLSGRGTAGQQLGDQATGTLVSYPFTVAGNSMSLLVGGTDNIEQCHVELVDLAADTVIYRETGSDNPTMELRRWNLLPHRGREVYLRIRDQDFAGHINLDHIVESMTPVAVDDATPTAAPLVDRGAFPNPFNPRTTIRFEARIDLPCRVEVYDLRGRRIWSTGLFAPRTGVNEVAWTGRGQDGRCAPAGVYVYRIVTVGGDQVSGKVTLAP